MKYKPVYMICTADEYELPIAVANSPSELSRITGKAIQAISKGIRRCKDGKNTIYQLVWVPWEEGDESV